MQDIVLPRYFILKGSTWQKVGQNSFIGKLFSLTTGYTDLIIYFNYHNSIMFWWNFYQHYLNLTFLYMLSSCIPCIQVNMLLVEVMMVDGLSGKRKQGDY